MAAEQILKKIDAGELKPGGKLPSQRELALILGIGRSSVREAINALVVMGYLSVLQGTGTFVRRKLPVSDLSVDKLGKALKTGSLLQLMEAREVLECKTAELAAGRADPTHIDRLRTILKHIESRGKDYSLFLQADIDFHTCLAEATDNTVICEMTKLVLEKVINHHSRLKTARLSPQYIRESVQTAKEVVACVAAGDGKGAAGWMEAHLRAIRKELDDVL